MKGFRVPAQKSKNERMTQIETELQNMQTAARISQMLVQQMMKSVKAMSDDLGNALNQLMEMQYKYSAVVKHLNLPTDKLDEIANAQRLVDFDNGSLKQDEKDNLVVADTVTDDSTVTLTSVATDAEGNDHGIFRSRIKLSDSGVPALIQELAGKKVGDKVKVKLNDLEHEVELLAIRNPAPEAPQVETTH